MSEYISRFKGVEIDEGVEKGLKVGELNDLKTVEKTNIVGAINEHIDKKNNPHETKLAFGIKWGVYNLDETVLSNSQLNLLKLIDPSNDLLFAENIQLSDFTFVNQGLDNMLMKLPLINQFVSYILIIRLIGQVSGSSVSEFFIDLFQSDGQIIDGRQIIMGSEKTLERRAVNMESATLNENDEFITGGIKPVINNPSLGGTINLTGLEIFIKGNM